MLPTSNVPETARITRLRHNKQSHGPVLAASDGRQPIVGADAVHAHLEMLNRQVLLVIRRQCILQARAVGCIADCFCTSSCCWACCHQLAS